MVIPNKVNIFGSASHEVRVSQCRFDGGQQLTIKRVRIKALDQPSYRCQSDASSINTSACIAGYIEKQIGCNPNIQGSQYSTGPPCTTKSQLLELKRYMDIFQENHDKDVYKLTGCLSPCEKDSFILQTQPIHCRDDGYAEFTLEFTIVDRWNKEEEEYIVYDTDSFIADVGGYMGLLLGFSILSLYHEMEALLKRFIPKTLLLCKGNNGVKMAQEVV